MVSANQTPLLSLVMQSLNFSGHMAAQNTDYISRHPAFGYEHLVNGI